MEYNNICIVHREATINWMVDENLETIMKKNRYSSCYK